MRFDVDDEDDPVVVQSAVSARRRSTADYRGDPAAQLDLVRRIEAQTGQAESSDGSIRVTVDEVGRVDSVWLDPRLSATSLAVLAEHVVQVCADAFDARLSAIARIAVEHADEIPPALRTQIEVATRRLGRRKTNLGG